MGKPIPKAKTKIITVSNYITTNSTMMIPNKNITDQSAHFSSGSDNAHQL